MTGSVPPQRSSLEGIRLKLERAEHHLDRLEAEVGAYNRRHPYFVPAELEAQDDGWFIARLVVREPPDPRWGVRVGEFVHNARSALDYLVWWLVESNKRKPTGDNQFPMFTAVPATDKDRAERRRALKRRLKGVPDEQRALIEALQPYTGGHVHRRPKLALTWLSVLSNTDKHRYLHPAFGALDPNAVSWSGVQSTHPITGHRSQVRDLLHHGAEVLAFRTAPEARVTMEGRIAFDVAFGHPGVTVSVLDGILEQVREIVERLKPASDAGTA